MVLTTVECPSNCWTVTISTPRFTSREANVCRSLCHVTPRFRPFGTREARPASRSTKVFRFHGYRKRSRSLSPSPKLPRLDGRPSSSGHPDLAGLCAKIERRPFSRSTFSQRSERISPIAASSAAHGDGRAFSADSAFPNFFSLPHFCAASEPIVCQLPQDFAFLPCCPTLRRPSSRNVASIFFRSPRIEGRNHGGVRHDRRAFFSPLI
jgi:hypothetical protein